MRLATALPSMRLPPMNPVLARELKQRMRGRHTWVVLTLYLAVLAVILRWVFVTASRDTSFGGINLVGSAGVGRAVFQWLLFFMLLLVCFIVPGLTAAAISGERERQTLVSLQISLLRPRSIVLGKLLASLAFVVLLVVASLPLVTIPFLVGGVSASEVAQGLVMVLATAVVLACLALMCSALLRRTQGATVLAYGMTLALVLGTLVVYGAQQIPRPAGSVRPRPWILALNPFAATADVVEGRSSASGSLESPFQPLVALVRLGSNDRIRDVLSNGPTGSDVTFFAPPPQAFVNSAGGGILAPAPVVVGTAPPTIAVPAPVPVRPPVFPGPSGPVFPAVGVGGQPSQVRTRLAGIPFWLVSLLGWSVLGAGALAVSVRRLSLPAAREAR